MTEPTLQQVIEVAKAFDLKIQYPDQFQLAINLTKLYYND